MSAVCLLVCVSAAENDWVFMLFSDSHQECNICKKACLEMASVGIETLLKAILERTDRLARNIGRRDHSKCTGDGCFESNLR